MKVLVTGATGLVGKAVCEFFAQAGHDVFKMVRRAPKGPDEIRWSPAKGTIDLEALEAAQIDAVVHLAGENIVGLWTSDKKRKIRNSRVNGTTLLAQTLSGLKQKPKVLVSASAIGYYGNRGDEVMTEMSEPGAAIDRQVRKKPFMLLDPNWGADFLSQTCMVWEDSVQPAREAGIRTVIVRIGVVLGRKGGILKHAEPAFKLGIAGPFGSGNQWMSWVAIDDLVGIIHHAVTTDTLKGPINAVSPNPVTNKDFTAEFSRRAFVVPFLGSAVNWVPAPSMVLKLGAGELAGGLFLSSTRVEPLRLLETGYKFKYPELSKALKHIYN